MKTRCVISLIVITAFMFIPQPVMSLIGPVELPPSGVDSDDTDDGSGEQWGRDGGRELSFTFTAGQIAQYDELLWGPLSVGIAFDNEINETGNEILSYTGTLGPNQAEWNGETRVEVSTGSQSYSSQTVDTKFILTATSGLLPVQFIFDTVTGLPYVDVMTLPSDIAGNVTFTVRLEMQAHDLAGSYYNLPCTNSYVPGSDYGPALDVYDCLRTHPQAEDYAITDFSWGFFYELTGPGPDPEIDLEDHHAEIAALIGGVEAKVNEVDWFIEDWRHVKPGLLGNQGDILFGIEDIGNTLDSQATLLESVRQNTDNISGQISNLPGMDLMLLLFGFNYQQFGLPYNENLPPFDELRPHSALYQAFDTHIDLLSAQLEEKGQMINDLQSQMTSMYTQEQLEQAVANAVADKNEQISQLITEMSSMFTQEQLDQIVSLTCPGKSENAQNK